MAVNSIVFEGKEFTLWTEKQLEAVNRAALKSRAMSIRDAVGADRLPPLPRHPEAMVAWILDVQSMLTGGKSAGGPPSAYGGRPASQDDEPAPYGAGRNPAYAPVRQGPPSHYEESNFGDQSSRDAHQAYVDSKVKAQAAKNRNQGGEMAGIMGR